MRNFTVTVDNVSDQNDNAAWNWDGRCELADLDHGQDRLDWVACPTVPNPAAAIPLRWSESTPKSNGCSIFVNFYDTCVTSQRTAMDHHGALIRPLL